MERCESMASLTLQEQQDKGHWGKVWRFALSFEFRFRKKFEKTQVLICVHPSVRVSKRLQLFRPNSASLPHLKDYSAYKVNQIRVSVEPLDTPTHNTELYIDFDSLCFFLMLTTSLREHVIWMYVVLAYDITKTIRNVLSMATKSVVQAISLVLPYGETSAPFKRQKLG